MRAFLTPSLVLLALHLAGAGASAQQYLAPPRAPDMMNPGYYYWTQTGMVYGPNYYVRPCFPPFQGAVMGPNATRQSRCQGGEDGPACWPCPAGGAAFPAHLFSRSPRDFFMADTDPRNSPSAFGGYGSFGRTGIDYP
jgi:hypothetical protein